MPGLILRKFKSFLFHTKRSLQFLTLTFNTFALEISYALKRSRTIAARKTSGKNCQKLVSIIVPVPGEGILKLSEERYYYRGLRRLLTRYLPRQTHTNFEVLVYCDGPNTAVKRLIETLGDARIQYLELERSTGLYGHPQTRQGFMRAKGEFVVRMNCDNVPYATYLELLLSGFNDATDLVYARVVFSGKARLRYFVLFIETEKYGIINELGSFLLPRDTGGIVRFSNISCMNYMVRTGIARKFAESWTDQYEADWFFIERLLRENISYTFIDALIGKKL